MNDCLILWMNILFYERLQNETHFAATGRATPLARTTHKEVHTVKWITKNGPVELTEEEVSLLADRAARFDVFDTLENGESRGFPLLSLDLI